MKVTRKIWSNLLMIILLIGMCAYPNMQVSASGKLKLSYEKNSETIVGKYVVVCGEGKTYIYKKSNPKTEIRKIDSVGHVLNKKLYWLKGTKLYSYNFNTKKTNAVDINI